MTIFASSVHKKKVRADQTWGGNFVRKQKQRFGPAFLVLGAMFVLIAAYIVGAYQMARPAEDRICKGVKIETVDVSGMTEEEAHIAVDGFITGLAGRTLEVDVNGKKVTTSMECRVEKDCSRRCRISSGIFLFGEKTEEVCVR